jgi:hypothetical protein
MKLTIQNPDHFAIALNEGIHYGFNQEWYTTPWQRLSGCGPTTASALLHYWLLPQASAPTQKEACAWMETLWSYVTPGIGGVYKVSTFQHGVDAYLKQNAIPSQVRALNVPKQKNLRPSLDAVMAFLQEALQADSPIAFLNLHNGDDQPWDDWHWTLAIGLSVEGEHVRLHNLDDGKQLEGDLKRWLESSKHGGGFVWIATP